MKLRHSILISLATSIVLSLSLTSCDNDKPRKDYDNRHNWTQEQDSPKTKTIEKDSLESLQIKIEELSQQNEDSSDDIKKLQSSVKDLDGLRFWMWISLSLGGLALLLSIIAMGKSSSSKGAVEDVEKSLKRIKLKLQNENHQPQQVSRNSSSNEVEQLKRRVWELESQIRQISLSISSGTNHNRHSDPTPEPVSQPQQQVKKGYFANPINGANPYFKKLLQYKEPEARFSAEISNNKAIFRPFDEAVYFNTYISFIDDYRAAIEFSGCDPKQATRMQIIKGGDAELRDGNWYITKKALVNLS